MGPAGGCTGGLPARCAPTSPSLQHVSLLPAPPGSCYFRSGLRWFSGFLPCRKGPGIPFAASFCMDSCLGSPATGSLGSDADNVCWGEHGNTCPGSCCQLSCWLPAWARAHCRIAVMEGAVIFTCKIIWRSSPRKVWVGLCLWGWWGRVSVACFWVSCCGTKHCHCTGFSFSVKEPGRGSAALGKTSIPFGRGEARSWKV